VCGDPVRLRQILINLIGNAIKFTEHGVVTMEAQVVDGDKEKIRLSFSVSDTGIGIPQNKLEDVFKSFVQASSSTTRKYGGTGLGLSISKYLVEMQHGTISVQSKLGKGTVFTFELTYKTAAETNNGNEKEKAGNEPSAEIKALEAIRVLVVEDNRFNQMVAVDSLQSSIPSVFIELVENGKLAIQKLETTAFDLVLLDLQMPEMDGYETTAYIRNEMQPPQKMIPIIALTANATKTEKEKCLKAGMNGYLSKPFRIDDLIAQIHTVIISHSLS
jgi:CheY-like chemotaxis protein